jgi:hypothetical protein
VLVYCLHELDAALAVGPVLTGQGQVGKLCQPVASSPHRVRCGL